MAHQSTGIKVELVEEKKKNLEVLHNQAHGEKGKITLNISMMHQK